MASPVCRCEEQLDNILEWQRIIIKMLRECPERADCEPATSMMYHRGFPFPSTLPTQAQAVATPPTAAQAAPATAPQVAAQAKADKRSETVFRQSENNMVGTQTVEPTGFSKVEHKKKPLKNGHQIFVMGRTPDSATKLYVPAHFHSYCSSNLKYCSVRYINMQNESLVLRSSILAAVEDETSPASC
jgi:hypothetical protein